MLKLCIRKERGTKHCQCLYDFHDVKRNKFALTNIFLCSINSITLHTETFFGFGISKSKIIPIHIMKAYGGIAPFVLNLGTRLRSVNSNTHQRLYCQGNRRQYPLKKRLGGSPSWSECFGQRNLLSLPGTRPQSLGCPSCSLVTTPAALYWLIW
jgi:hypothetical protein